MNPEKKNPTDSQIDELVALLDSLAESGSQHINLNIGTETKVQTVNSTECNPALGPCAVPNFDSEVPPESDEDDEL